LRAAVVGSATSLVFDGSDSLRRRVLRDSVVAVDEILATRSATDRFVYEHVGVGHPAGTCRMGSREDREAVTDSRCRVIGVEGLRVVDASIFPTAMTAGPNIPIIMAAEKAVDMMIEDRKVGIF
jgi:5-(hydroxymethyl)furfural/furfural oxidase